MITQIQNEQLKVSVDTHGAELTSIKKSEEEYLWEADPKIWGRHAPILFPIVGKLKDNKYSAQSKTFSLSQHGFARDSEFELVNKSEDKLVFRLQSNEETLKIYPYKFELIVEYKLVQDKLAIRYTVKNADEDDIYFSIGSHPGFACPGGYDDYYLEFENYETAERHFLEDGVYSGKKELVLNNENVLKLHKDIFKDDAIVFKGLKSNKVTLKNQKDNRQVELEFSDFPYLGIWAKVGAPFVCIEPWLGLADNKDDNVGFENKEGIQKLRAQWVFECEYTIKIG